MVKKVLLILFILIVIGGGVGFYVFSQPPSDPLSDEFKEEAVTKILGRKAQLNNPDVRTGNATFEGRYIVFDYPARAAEYTYRDPDSKVEDDGEDFSFDIDSPRVVFNMKNISYTQSLEDYPAVRLRNDRSYEYERSELTIGKIKGLAFFKRGFESEKSGFFATGSRIYTISATGSNEEEVERLFDEVISSAFFVE